MVESGAVTIHIGGSKISNDSLRRVWSYKKAIKKEEQERAMNACVMCTHVLACVKPLPFASTLPSHNWVELNGGAPSVSLPSPPLQQLCLVCIKVTKRLRPRTRPILSPFWLSFLCLSVNDESPSSFLERYTFPAFFHASVEFDPLVQLYSVDRRRSLQDLCDSKTKSQILIKRRTEFS